MSETVFDYSESDFYEYLTKYGNVNSHSRTNYMSWMSFLTKHYQIDSNLNNSIISEILAEENIKRTERNIYKTEKDISNFRSTLRKYIEFLNFDFSTRKEHEIEKEIETVEQDITIEKTERAAIISSRVGQGDFRKRLIQYWRGCSITHFGKYDLLIASHIKPWRDSNNKERLDTFNGLLLLPNYDKLFDKGYISFDRNGKILLSKFVNDADKNILGLSKNISLIKIEERHIKYLDYHLNNCFMG